MKNKYFLVSLFAMFLFFSCENDDTTEQGITPSNNNPETFLQNFGSTIHRDFLGQVIDKNKNPIEDVQITIGSSVAFTDSNGVFIIKNTAISKRFGFVKAEKEGYIHGSRAVVPSEGVNKVTIMLLEEAVTGTTSSGEVETISLPNGASVALNGAYINESGATYEGSVNVILHHLDPTDDDMTEQMPGMLLAANSQDEAVMLKTLGMLAVELRGTNGEDLNLAENSTAEIRIPVANELLSEAPNTIPLWYFDEENGYWIEEGEAQLIGNEYVGTVTHFSFWNCDLPIEYTDLCINLTDIDGNPVSNTEVTLSSATSGTTSGITNTNGQVCGFIPSNEILEINITNPCDTNTPLYSTTIGPYSTSSTIDISVNTPDFIIETIRGHFLDCNGNPVTNGYIQVNLYNETFTETITDGIIDFNVLRCTNLTSFSLNAVDLNNAQTTGALEFSYTGGETNIGFIHACEEIDSYITYQIDDHPVITYLDNLFFNASWEQASVIYNYVLAHYPEYLPQPGFDSAYTGFQLKFNLLSPGIYSTANEEIHLSIETDANGDSLGTHIHESDITVNSTTTDYISGTASLVFYGTYVDDTGEHTITGRIHGSFQ